MAKALVIAAPQSGSGKTLVTLALLRALANAGVDVDSRKVGPDYIDPAFHHAASGKHCTNLDPWAMRSGLLCQLAASECDVTLIEGVMGLFDGALDGTGSSADLALSLGLPIVLIVDASKQSSSVAALIYGFAHFRDDVVIAGVIFNKVGSMRHEALLRTALAPLNIPCLGAIHRHDDLHLPSRHLGLVQAGEHGALESFLDRAAEIVSSAVDLEKLTGLAMSLPENKTKKMWPLAPLGQRIAVAQDACFSFCYDSILSGWQVQGAEILPFSPLADEGPSVDADAVYLPGGYPELHGDILSSAVNFLGGLGEAAARDALIYGECGGYMVLGEALLTQDGVAHQMVGLLPHVTSMAKRVRHLGYREFRHRSRLPFAPVLRGHEFHYSSQIEAKGEALFSCVDALGTELPSMGLQAGNVMGSYGHIIDEAGQ